MALEQVFECPSTLAKFEAPPLGKLLEGFCKWLLEKFKGVGSLWSPFADAKPCQ